MEQLVRNDEWPRRAARLGPPSTPDRGGRAASSDRVRDRVRELVDGGETDVDKIVDTVLAELAVDEIEELARAEVSRRVTRRVACGHGQQSRHGQRKNPWGPRAPSARMSALAESSHDLERWLVDIGGEWKLLLDCTFDEVRHVASRHLADARRLTGQARRYETLARRMRDADARTVDDLPRATVTETMLQ